jgi:Domain of unknown function (DUF4224)
MSTPLFLDDAQLVQFTGCRFKSRQIAWLRAEGVVFRVNATGHPVVTVSAVEGKKPEPAADGGWIPQVLQFNKEARTA